MESVKFVDDRNTLFINRLETSEWSTVKCAVKSCPNRETSFTNSNTSYTFHDFPKNANDAIIWKKKCDLPDDSDVTSAKICSDHFSLEDYVTVQGNSVPLLKSGAVPSRNLQENVLDVKFSLVRQIVDENSRLIARRAELVDFTQAVENKTLTYERRIKHLDKATVNIKNKLKKLKERVPKIKQEKDLMSQVFSEAQVNILLGRKNVRWSDDDLARAFTLRHMGGKECYLYLKNTLNIPLPALSCVQKWASSNV